MNLKLTPERRTLLVEALARHFEAEFDEPLSDFRAQGLIDFFLKELGPPVYNQGVRDAAAYLQGKLNDIDGEIYEPESR